MQRIEATGEGIAVTHVTEPLVPPTARKCADAVRQLCRLSGLPVPDHAASTAADVAIWPGTAL